MKTYLFDSPETGQISYSDKKRWLWLLSFTYPLFPLIGLYLYWLSELTFALWVPVIFAYLGIPLLDWLIGEDENNPPEEIVPLLEQDPYYQRLLYATVPLHFVMYCVSIYWIVNVELTTLGYIAIAIATGMASGLGINTGHELGHKSDALGKFLAKIVLAVPAYGHFSLEHNAGHHRYVATPGDTASSKMGENIYRFALREFPGGVKRGWNLEKQRLQSKGLSTWSFKNNILQSYAITAVIQIGALLYAGWLILPFLLIHNVVAWWQLTSANYIEHYGLLREQKENGRYETCKPHHSWNSNHLVSNLLLFQLERHSDHHAYPSRHYQSLRHFDDLPSLPNGYAGAYLLAYVPWLWYKVMDKRLLKLKHIDGDLSKVNVHEPARAKIIQTNANLIKE